MKLVFDESFYESLNRLEKIGYIIDLLDDLVIYTGKYPLCRALEFYLETSNNHVNDSLHR